jgi:hypothetical protein
MESPLFCSDNCEEFCEYVSLGHEIRPHQAEISRASQCRTDSHRNKQAAWDQPAHGNELGAGNGATPAQGRVAPTEVDAKQKDLNPLTFSIY